MKYLLFILLICFQTIQISNCSAQPYLGITGGYDNDFLHIGLSMYKDGSKKVFSTRTTCGWTENLKNKSNGVSGLFSIGYIVCLGFDQMFYYHRYTESPLYSFKPKLGLGILKYGMVSYGYNMFTNGDRSWTWSVEINIPIYKLPVKGKK